MMTLPQMKVHMRLALLADLSSMPSTVIFASMSILIYSSDMASMRVLRDGAFPEK